MKVIVAGMPKTGTKSMVVALQQLGYSVYDIMENYQYLRDDWERIFKDGGTEDDFRRMFENVDAVTDLPSAYFWDEIHRAFPDAKIILTTRENEDVWFRSSLKQTEVLNNWKMRLASLLSPTLRNFRTFLRIQAAPVFGSDNSSVWTFEKPKVNETLFRMRYRRHNAHVLQNAPKDKLLVYSVNDGWEPLCNFLGKEVPSVPFPRKNVRGNILEEFLQKHPVFIKMKREAALSFGLIAVLTVYGMYKLARGSTPVSWAEYWLHSLIWAKSKITALNK